VPLPAGFVSRRPRVIDPPARDHYDENSWSDRDLWYAYDVRYHFIARSARGMALYASIDTDGRDVEIGIDAEYGPDEAIIHFDRLRWRGRNRPAWAKGRK
jgi:hypothetical protein